MSISRRLKTIEKQVASGGLSEALEAELLDWMSANPYIDSPESSFYDWCERMPKHLTGGFAAYIKKHVLFERSNLLG